MRVEKVINKYKLRKENGCFDINKALKIEKTLTDEKEIKIFKKLLD